MSSSSNWEQQMLTPQMEKELEMLKTGHWEYQNDEWVWVNNPFIMTHDINGNKLPSQVYSNVPMQCLYMTTDEDEPISRTKFFTKYELPWLIYAVFIGGMFAVWLIMVYFMIF